MPVYDACVSDGKHEPRYRRVAADLRSRIAAGEFPVGSALPSQRSLAESYSVALATLDRAVRLLAEEGMIEVTPGAGTFVISAESRPRKTLAERVADLERRLDRHEQEHGQ